MKSKTQFILILASFLLAHEIFAQGSATGGRHATSPRGIRIQFNSYGNGINESLSKKILKLISHEMKNRQLESYSDHTWGLDGEWILCAQFKNDRASDFKNTLDQIVAKTNSGLAYPQMVVDRVSDCNQSQSRLPVNLRGKTISELLVEHWTFLPQYTDHITFRSSMWKLPASSTAEWIKFEKDGKFTVREKGPSDVMKDFVGEWKLAADERHFRITFADASHDDIDGTIWTIDDTLLRLTLDFVSRKK